jgi:hypothetical protein
LARRNYSNFSQQFNKSGIKDKNSEQPEAHEINLIEEKKEVTLKKTIFR